MAHGSPVEMHMNGVLPTAFTNAGWNMFGDGRFGYIGWMGAGGSCIQWQPDEGIGFGYAMNLLFPTPQNERASILQQVLLDCARVASRGSRLT